MVRKGLKDWVLPQEEDRWSVKFDVRDLAGASRYYFSWMVFDS